MDFDFGIDLGINPAEWFGEDRGDEQRAQNIALQREFAQNSIRWRVKDAKKAGLHPLFGLSGGGASFSPNPVTVSDGTTISARPGQDGGARSRAQQELPLTETQKQQAALQERAANNEHARTLSGIATDTALQEKYRAEADYTRQLIKDAQSKRTDQVRAINKERAVVSPIPTNPEDAWKYEPREVMPPRSEANPVAAGDPGAGFEPIWIAPGVPALVPSGAAQNLGDMELIGWLASAFATAAWWGHSAGSAVLDYAKKLGHRFSRAQEESLKEARKNLPPKMFPN